MSPFQAYIVACLDLRLDIGSGALFLVPYPSIFWRAGCTVVPSRYIKPTTDTIVPIVVSFHRIECRATIVKCLCGSAGCCLVHIVRRPGVYSPSASSASSSSSICALCLISRWWHLLWCIPWPYSRDFYILHNQRLRGGLRCKRCVWTRWRYLWWRLRMPCHH